MPKTIWSGTPCWSAIAASACLSLVTGIAAATPPPTRLSVTREEGAESCPEERVLRRELEQGLGRSVLDAHAARSLEVLFTREARRWVARVLLRESPPSSARTRTLESEDPSCRTLFEPLVVALTLALAADRSELPLERASEPATPALTRTPPPALVQEPPPSPWSERARVVGRAAMLWGPVPGLSFAGGFECVVGPWGPFRLAASALLVADTSAHGADRDFSFGLAALELLGCVGTARGRVSILGCAGAEVGVLRVAGLDVDAGPNAASYPQGALLVGGRFTVHLVGPLLLDLGLDLGVALRPDRFLAQAELVPGGLPTPAVVVFQQAPLVVLPHVGLGLAMR